MHCTATFKFGVVLYCIVSCPLNFVLCCVVLYCHV
jgi:hypothetical protein